ncbi:MAG: hypothetical protein QOI26_684 [Pseudonocardiales bacterium]|nr:hypothetical protein [Pseudonocardiales bacterium]
MFADADADADAAVLRGSDGSPPGFCAGSDLMELADASTGTAESLDARAGWMSGRDCYSDIAQLNFTRLCRPKLNQVR